MKTNNLKERTLNFTSAIMELVGKLPEKKAVNVVSDQILRSSTSVGANYRAACRSKSLRDFINKLKIVEEEADETMYWLEVLEKRKLGYENELKRLIGEANELVAIFVTSINTAKSNLSLQSRQK